MNNIEKSFKNLSEIVESCEDDIKSNNKNITAILDLEDLKSLKAMLLEFDKLKKDNYKLDRENQLLFEKQVPIKRCKCCEYIQELKKIKKEMSYLKSPDIKEKWKAVIANYTYRKGLRKPVGIIEYKSYDLNYCPMCGEKINNK